MIKRTIFINSGPIVGFLSADAFREILREGGDKSEEEIEALVEAHSVYHDFEDDEEE